MKLHRFDSIKDFWHRSQPYLLQHEAEHNLMLGILYALLHHPERYPHPPYLATVEAEGDILAIAMRTPPYKLVLSKAQNLEACQLIAQDVQHQQHTLPGVSGLVSEVETFLQAWQTLTGQSYKSIMEMRIHQLTQIEPVATANGFLRLATESDRPLLLEWYEEFIDEAIASFGETAERLTDNALQRQTAYIWEDNVPVSFACGHQSLSGAARIGPVYTPPAYRRKGYATACVTALSQTLLDQGCDRCFLFTDLANPTSNHIYQTIGYRPICDWHDYSFISEEQL